MEKNWKFEKYVWKISVDLGKNLEKLGKKTEIWKKFRNLENLWKFGKILIFGIMLKQFRNLKKIRNIEEILRKKIGNLEIGDLENWKLDIDIWISELLH